MMKIKGSSMWPLLRSGDYIICQKRAPYVVGDVLVFEQRRRSIAHRIIGAVEDGGGTAFYTKGDLNFRRDPQVTTSQIVGVAVGRVRRGRYTSFNQRWRPVAGFLLSDLIPVLGTLLTLIRQPQKAAAQSRAPHVSAGSRPPYNVLITERGRDRR